ncbi:hypothetical protein [Fischerella thermalis]
MVSLVNCLRYYASVLVIGFSDYRLPITDYQPTRQYKYLSGHDMSGKFG